MSISRLYVAGGFPPGISIFLDLFPRVADLILTLLLFKTQNYKIFLKYLCSFSKDNHETTLFYNF